LNRAQVEAYIAGKNVFPRTIEMDVSTRCTRKCPMCPSAGSSLPATTLTPGFVDRLLGAVEGETRGLILSGGEPTYSPHFVEILRIARRRRFLEVAAISNGSELGRPEIQVALMEYATSVRVSLYDWYLSDTPAKPFFDQLEKVAALRKRIDAEGSKLEIGVALLTSRDRLERLTAAARYAAESGCHWLYFHPLCTDWGSARPVQDSQEGVLEAVAAFERGVAPGVKVQIPKERYTSYPLRFSAFHSAHFLMQVGADGINYCAPEAKYHPGCAIADLNRDLDDGFLWCRERLEAIAALNSDRYTFAATRHRGSMFSDFMERCVQLEAGPTAALRTASERDFLYPHLC
jgi:pyruvate-formate lyase-activating enzyme